MKKYIVTNIMYGSDIEISNSPKTLVIFIPQYVKNVIHIAKCIEESIKDKTGFTPVDFIADNIDRAIKKFIKEFGLTDAKASKITDLDRDDSFSEMMINFGYTWLPNYKRWVDKNNSSYSDCDIMILDHLININI